MSERPGSSSRDLAAEPNSFATNRGVSQEAQAAAPRVLKFSGVLLDASGKPLSGEVEVTFALYKQDGDEEALWTETQHVVADERGGYTALLGVTQATGIPAEVFRSDEARWLGVQVQGQVQQPRTLLVSVPYALKAVEAEKLAGKSASDFVLSEGLGDQVRRVIEGQTIVASQATSTGTPQPGQTKANSTSTAPTTAAGPMFPPSTFSGTNATQIVQVTQNGTGNGLVSQTASSTGNSGVVGIATSNSTSNNQNGVIGFNAGAGAGVAGIATNPSAGVGVYGQSSTGFAGVIGNSVVNSGFAAGVFGTTSSPDGAGVHGANNNTTGFATGVTGFSASVNGNAVFGSASATSGFANGVFGQTNSPGGSGVLGIENATTGFNSGVSGSSASANGTGVFGSSFQWVGVGGQATAPSGGPAFGVWGDSLSTGGVGVAGFEDATSGFTNGVMGTSVSPDGNGVLGVSNVNAAPCNQGFCPEGVGVRGIANGTNGNAYGVIGDTATTGFGAGVIGNADATSGSPFGVVGRAFSPNGNGMFGIAASTSGFPTATVGFLESQQGGVAGQFVAHGGAGLILQGLSGPNFNQVFSVDANGNLNISGNLVVSGTKSSTARLQSGREVALYAVESPENWFEDFGSAELKGGAAWVPLDASFAEATNAAVIYHVFLTPNGDSNGLYVARKTATGFEVREHGGGDSNVAFDYRIVVRRRGYEAVRMAEVQRDVKIADASRQHLAEFVSSGVAKKAAAAKAPQIVTPAAIRPVPQRPNVQQPPKPMIPQVPKVSVAQPPQPK
ncbi:MAG TPA: hypothetical protein VGR55_14435 [Candidatus Acidoferrum sp.]|nr:hypothetical protein [Candidatus Acidoferrum sp.]